MIESSNSTSAELGPVNLVPELTTVGLRLSIENSLVSVFATCALPPGESFAPSALISIRGTSSPASATL